MGIFNKAEAPSIGQDAAKAIADGRSVFVAMLPVRLKDTTASREIEAWSEEIMSIEQAGWLLTQTSTVEDHSLATMYCVFHRR